MLQTMRLEVNCYPMEKGKAYIFVVEQLQRDGLNPKVYPNAIKRAQKTKEFLEMLGFEVEICLNFTKQQTVEKFEKIQKLAD